MLVNGSYNSYSFKSKGCFSANNSRTTWRIPDLRFQLIGCIDGFISIENIVSCLSEVDDAGKPL